MRTLSLIIVYFIFSLVLAGQAMASFKKTKLAVLDFQMKGAILENSDMGAIVAEWLITALVKEGRFDVVERRLLKKVIEEQKLTMSGVVDSSSATELGKILGVKVIISGSIMKFQNVIEVNARIIDVESASIIAAESVKTASAVQLEDLVVQMAAKIISDFPLEGYVVSKAGREISIDLGRNTGVKRGMRFIVYKEGNIIKHPRTGEVLDIEMVKTGEIVITNIRKKVSKAQIIRETAGDGIEYGQLIKSMVDYTKPIGRLTTPAPRPETPPPSQIPEIIIETGSSSVFSIGLENITDPTLRNDLMKVDRLFIESEQLKLGNDRRWRTTFKEALVILRPAYKRFQDSPYTNYFYAKAYFLEEKYSSAEGYLKRAIKSDQRYAAAYIFYGDVERLWGEQESRNRRKLFRRSLDHYQLALNNMSDPAMQALIYYKMGSIYAELEGKKGKANEYWEKALLTNPGSKGANMARAKLGR